MSTGVDLRDHLVRHRIAGDVATTRENNLRNFARMAEGREKHDFGLVPLRTWTADEVALVMAERCGTSADLTHVKGQDTIDPDLAVAQLDRWCDRLALAASRQERVLLATGHPTGILAIHLEVAAALRAAGCRVLVPEMDWTWPWDAGSWGRARPRHVRAVGGVHLLASGGELLHTHLPEPMHAVLAALDAPSGPGRPDLVIADHGWAGAAVQAGHEVLALADCNDPALFVAEHEGRPIVTVPLDDNVLPQLYDPISAHLTSWRTR